MSLFIPAARSGPVLALVLLVAACAAPLSETPPAGAPAQVQAPTVSVGDSWTYRVTDGFTHLPRPDQRLQVKAVSGDRVEIAGNFERGDGSLVFDRDWNWLKRPATNLQTFEYTPAYQAFSFPLAPGKRWQARSSARDPVDGRRFPVWIEGKVLGWERVKVPAGEFDALKVERNVYIEYWEYAVRGRSAIREFEWYAPAVKQSVKREERSSYLSYRAEAPGEPAFVLVRDRSDGGGPKYVLDDWLVYELAAHTVR